MLASAKHVVLYDFQEGQWVSCWMPMILAQVWLSFSADQLARPINVGTSTTQQLGFRPLLRLSCPLPSASLQQ